MIDKGAMKSPARIDSSNQYDWKRRNESGARNYYVVAVGYIPRDFNFLTNLKFREY